jgi:hypothetical protein
MKKGMFVCSMLSLALLTALPGLASADTYTFNFTGRMTVGMGTFVITDGTPEFDGYQTPINASLTYDTVTGLGSSSLSLTTSNLFLGWAPTFHDITMSRIGSTNLFNGQFLTDWGSSYNMSTHIEWDATGFMNAVNSGQLQVGDKISGDVLFRDANNDHTYSQVVISSLGSATPFADALVEQTMVNGGTPFVNYTPQYYAPLAATSGTQGLTDGPFAGVKVYMDIGSGNSLYVTSIATVPEPETYAMMLAGLGLVGGMVARRRKQAKA